MVRFFFGFAFGILTLWHSDAGGISWNLGFGIYLVRHSDAGGISWDLEFGVWDLEFGICHLDFSHKKRKPYRLPSFLQLASRLPTDRYLISWRRAFLSKVRSSLPQPSKIRS